jgi:malonate decarboxylase alpha subunit
VDIPGDRVDFVVVAPKPFYVEPLFTRDPASITETQILAAMMAIKGIYAEYGIKRLNHGVGFNTAAIELLLPTYAEKLGLKGKIATHWALNPHPTLIPAIESGWVKQIHSPGSEVGMDAYMRARSDIYFTGRDGSMGSNRMYMHLAGLYATDLFIGSTLQIDLSGNSSTVTADRIAGFGGAPNLGSDAHGRRHPSEPWLRAGREAVDGHSPLMRGRKLVVQIVETFSEKMVPVFVEKLDSLELAEKFKLDLAPVMIYGDDVTHIVSEEGIAKVALVARTLAGMPAQACGPVPLVQRKHVHDVAGIGRLQRHASELLGYLERNKGALVHYAARRRCGEPISTAFVESAVNEIVAKRMNKKQQMRWCRATVQPFLDVRTAVLNDTLEAAFRRRYPGFRPADDDEATAAAA